MKKTHVMIGAATVVGVITGVIVIGVEHLVGQSCVALGVG